MPESVLIAVDESNAAEKAVDYAGRLFGNRDDDGLTITLFHVAEGVTPEAIPEPDDPNMAALFGQAVKEWSIRAEQRGKDLLETHRGRLIEAGIPAEAVRVKQRVQETRPEARRVAAALAIIEEAKEGGYSTVVVGRRGTSNLPELFLGGVAEKVSRHVHGATVWIVD